MAQIFCCKILKIYCQKFREMVKVWHLLMPICPIRPNVMPEIALLQKKKKAVAHGK